MKEVKVFYEQVKCSPEVAQQRIDEAFDILFDEVFRQMKLKQQKIDKKSKTKGGEAYDRLEKGRDESYLGL